MQRIPKIKLTYQTIDQLRSLFKSLPSHRPQSQTEGNTVIISEKDILFNFNPSKVNIVVILSGVSVPGKYLGGTPLRSSEIPRLCRIFPHALKIFCGPATTFGIGEEGGKPSVPVTRIASFFDLIIYGDPEIALDKLFREHPNPDVWDTDLFSLINNTKRQSMEEIASMAIKGAEIVTQHPNFRPEDGGNLICEIETFRGCPRYRNGGCAFCVEPKKGPVMQRSIDDIIAEIQALYSWGVRHFRLGNQTDFFAFHHLSYDDPRYPRPNPIAIENLLRRIRVVCPNLKTLHIDNVNALNFVLYPDEARRITELIVKHCTSGNIAAIGVESIDPIVFERNNLKVSSQNILDTVQVINDLGREIGPNGVPKFLPGLNFIMGLPGETKTSLELNYQLLKEIRDRGLWLRRINLRKLLVTNFSSGMSNEALELFPTIPSESTTSFSTRKQYKDLRKNERYYYGWKDRIRNEIDYPILQAMFPFGKVLTDVFSEIHEGNGTFLRQVGTYPILCFVPRILPLRKFCQLVVINQGFRSLDCLEYPVDFHKLTRKEWESIPGIGAKRAKTLSTLPLYSGSELNKVLPIEIVKNLNLLHK